MEETDPKKTGTTMRGSGQGRMRGVEFYKGPDKGRVGLGMQGEPIAINYFAMDCQQDAVPKLFYTKGAETHAFLSSRRGFNDPLYKLPALNA